MPYGSSGVLDYSVQALGCPRLPVKAVHGVAGAPWAEPCAGPQVKKQQTQGRDAVTVQLLKDEIAALSRLDSPYPRRPASRPHCNPAGALSQVALP